MKETQIWADNAEFMRFILALAHHVTDPTCATDDGFKKKKKKMIGVL